MKKLNTIHLAGFACVVLAACMSPNSEADEQGMLEGADSTQDAPGELLAAIELSPTHSIQIRESAPGDITVTGTLSPEGDEPSAFETADIDELGLHGMYRASVGEAFDPTVYERLQAAQARVDETNALYAEMLEAEGIELGDQETEAELIDKASNNRGDCPSGDKASFEAIVSANNRLGTPLREASNKFDCASGEQNDFAARDTSRGYQAFAFNQLTTPQLGPEVLVSIQKLNCGWFGCSWNFKASIEVPPRFVGFVFSTSGGNYRTGTVGTTSFNVNDRWSFRARYVP